MNPPSDRSQFRSLTQIIGDGVRTRIFDGTYRPGMRLNITDLANAFDASSVPVREALRNLEAEGLVDFRPNRGAVVKELTAAELRELFLIRSSLETLGITQAAEQWLYAEQLDPLERIIAQMASPHDSPEWHNLHDQFHQELLTLSGLPRVAQLATLLRSQMRPYTRVYLMSNEQLTRAHEEHIELLDCVRRRDIAPIAQIVHRHISHPVKLILAGLKATGVN